MGTSSLAVTVHAAGFTRVSRRDSTDSTDSVARYAGGARTVSPAGGFVASAGYARPLCPSGTGGTATITGSAVPVHSSSADRTGGGVEEGLHGGLAAPALLPGSLSLPFRDLLCPNLNIFGSPAPPSPIRLLWSLLGLGLRGPVPFFGLLRATILLPVLRRSPVLFTLLRLVLVAPLLPESA